VIGARRLKRLCLITLAVLAAIPVIIVLGFAIGTRLTLSDLRPWHRTAPVGEFRADRTDITSFEQYRELERGLLTELRDGLVDDPARADDFVLGRYNPNSVPARLALGTPYNFSYELEPETLRGAALLVHGLSDSPYAMRAVAEQLRDEGFYVVALRLPGHGTVPAGLLDVSWRDWYAAVELAARHAAERAGSGPLYLGGFSTGAALTTLYAVRALEDPSLPSPRRLILISPAIGIPSGARLTRKLSLLSFLPVFEKSKWIDVDPEYDPFKYNSFPVNAARQIYDLTVELAAAMEHAGRTHALERMPDVLAFQSLVDATISAPEVVKGLFVQLSPADHELVVFDVNQRGALRDLVSPVLRAGLDKLRSTHALPFRLMVVTNRSPDAHEVVLIVREAGEVAEQRVDLGLAWPAGVLSLGHVSLPFPIDDAVYGLQPVDGGELDYALGALTMRGESGTLVVPLEALARLRSNPFFDVIRARIHSAVESDFAR
jgi:alpha-beta hydrolase superfamily lysophospholipase